MRGSLSFVPVALVLTAGCATFKGGTAPIDASAGHIYVQARINGEGPFTLRVATGEGVFISPAVAQKLGLDVYRLRGVKDTVLGFGADRYAVRTRVRSMEVGEAAVPNLLVSVLEPTDDPLNPAEDGVLGYEFLRQFRVTVDYPSKTLIMEPL